MQTFVEYRVRPVTRYAVTRYERQESDDGTTGSCASVVGKGEFDSEHVAYEVGYALAKDEHGRLGYPVGDERIQYPKPLNTDTTYVQPAALHEVRAQMPRDGLSRANG